MIRSVVLGFNKPNKAVSNGDCEIIRNEKYNLVIDGYCGDASNKVISYLKKRKMKELYLILSHAHYDHYYGLLKIIRDSYFIIKAFYCYNPKTLEVGLCNNKGSEEVRDDINALRSIISECNKRGIDVIYLDNGDKLIFGDIKIDVYRKQPTKVEDDDTKGYSYINDGSLCFYFPDLYYWTSGDGPERIGDFIKELGIKVKYFKIPHHGNSCTKLQSQWLKGQGANYCWYNFLEPNGVGTDEFTEFGARRCKQAGINVFTAIGDINWVAKNGSMTIYKGGKAYSFSVKYQGGSTLKSPIVSVIRGVFENKYGTSDYRTTNLLDVGYNPTAVQTKVNLVIQVAKDIINKKVNFGKNETRLKNLDKKYGNGYGELIQDEINSLLKSKIAKW